MSTIRSRFVQIGNSRGLRIPKVLIDQLGLGGDVEIRVQRDQLVIRAASQFRSDWDEQFKAMAERGDDTPRIDAQTSSWDDSEWEW